MFLSGCQLTGGTDTPDLENSNFNNMSCNEIKALFDDYKDTMDTTDTFTELLSAVGVETDTRKAESSMIQAYNRAKKAAKPIMRIKNCKEKI